MKIPRKVVVAGVASVLVAGMAGASAASLGALGGDSLGSADNVVTACDNNIGVEYTTAYSFANSRTEVTAVTLTDLSDDCDGLDATLTLRSVSAVLGSAVTVPVPSDAATTLTISINPGVSAEAVEGISLVIAG
jgi:hypothetical protein